MSARGRRFVRAMQRCCGAACQLAMDQIPSIADPELRAAFTSWARLGLSDEAGPMPAAFGHAAAVEVTP